MIGKQKSEITRSDLEKFMFPPDVIYVKVDSKDINNNNFAQFSEFELFEVDGSPFEIPKANGKPQCELCFRIFDKHSQLYSHQGKLCIEDKITNPHPVKIRFPARDLYFVEDAIKGLNKELASEPGGHYSILVDAAHVTITLRQLYTAQVTKYNLEQWYPLLTQSSPDAPLTAPTAFLELTDADLKIVSALSKNNLAANLGMDYRLTNAELEGQQELIEKIEAVMDPAKTYFCRLSTRSPKDGVSVSAEDKKLAITERLKKKLSLLAVSNAEQVVNLITRSQRVFSDIQFYFQYRVPGSTSGKLYLILRDFLADLPIDHEFRCFVHNRKLTAISQYQCYCVFPALADEAHVRKCRESMIECFEKVKNVFAMDSYIIDLVVFPDYSCQVIELNPFGIDMAGGSGLFNWVKDYDLLYGKLDIDYVPIRVLSALIDEENTKAV
eukprot:TRINITY_DN17503_c0_g1_i1.p1 TRINITY_DN17503_c0_g1~~TRINITY_DN17503_c0_g1_i1.p1  ORF type:complete len:440 (-),score=92.11 TRINITY_DN17503_c0_g1_i1:51-1370(-)